VGLVLIVLIAYAPTLSSEFVRLDDYQYVVDNRLVRDPSWTSVRRFFTEVETPSTVDGYYQPLTMTSLMIDAYVTGGQALDPFIYHLTNILLHAGTCVLVMFVMRLAVGGVAVPLLAAALFAVHPVQVESIAWVSQRKTVLSTLLAMGCIACYLNYARKRIQGSSDPPSWAARLASGDSAQSSIVNRQSAISQSPWPWLAASVLLYLVGGLAKPTVVLLPLVLPLLDIWPLRRRLAAGLLDKLPFAVCMAPMAWVAWTSQASSSAQLLAPNLSSLSVLAKLFSLICHNLMMYLGNVFWPMTLSPYREIPLDVSTGNVTIVLSVVFTMALAAVCLSAYRWSKPLFVGSAAFLILLAPALGAIRFVETCVADRFLYLPGIFLLLPFAALIVRIEEWVPHRRTWVRAGFGLLAVPMLVLMRPQQGVWHDSCALWGHVVEMAPSLAKGHAQRAGSELDAGNFETALLCARRAVERNPHSAECTYILGLALVRNGQSEQAVATAKEAIAKGLGPLEPLGYVSLAEALILAGDTEGARVACEQAITLGRGKAGTYRRLGDTALNFAKRYDVTADYYHLALACNPDDVAARWNLGTALEYLGRDAEALNQYERVFDVYAGRGIQVPPNLEQAAQALRRRLDRATSKPSEE